MVEEEQEITDWMEQNKQKLIEAVETKEYFVKLTGFYPIKLGEHHNLRHSVITILDLLIEMGITSPLDIYEALGGKI